MGGTPPNAGRDPPKTAHLGGDQQERPVFENRTVQERVWLLMVRENLSERAVAKMARASRWKVRELKAKWITLGWLKARKGGGVVVTDEAPKNLRDGWAATPPGSPLAPPQRAKRIGDAARVHRGKLSADLDRSVDPASLDWWEAAKAQATGVIYHRYVLPCRTSMGIVGVPVQVIQPKRLDRPFKVVVQSANIMAKEANLVSMGREEALVWVLESMTVLVHGWLGEDAALLGPLSWVGLDREDLEVAVQASRAAPVKGDVQRDFVAVDKSDRFSPFSKEEEQTLTAFVVLRGLERDVALLMDGQSRVAQLLERVIPSVTEQVDGLAAAVEALHGRG